MRLNVLLIAVLAAVAPCAWAETAQGVIGAASASCAAGDNGCVALRLAATDSSASVTLSGTWQGTPKFEGSADFGSSWASVAGVSWSNPTGQPATFTTGNGGWTVDVAGKTNVRVRMDVYASGSLSVGISSAATRASLPNTLAGTVVGSLGTGVARVDNGRLAVRTPPTWYANDGVNLKPISATAAVNNALTLTIPTPPPGLSNYVCTLGLTVSQDGTATAINNSVTTSTNFNSFAFQFSVEDVAQKDWKQIVNFATPLGCVKSDLPSTATTFISPAAVANASFAWQAVYYQAP